tara:strand:- start:5522 stop:5839 length:318 start_codon:yes stop_codon:yes gene_type:complete
MWAGQASADRYAGRAALIGVQQTVNASRQPSAMRITPVVGAAFTCGDDVAAGRAVVFTAGQFPARKGVPESREALNNSACPLAFSLIAPQGERSSIHLLRCAVCQ